MNERFQTLVYGAVLALIVGWVLYLGRSVFVPVVFSVLVVYVIVGLTRLLEKIPFLGTTLPAGVRYAVSILLIGAALVASMYLVFGNKGHVLALAPQYQASLLATIQKAAVFLHIETEPTWATLRHDILAQLNLQTLIGMMVSSVSSIVVTILVVILYASFLLVEKRSFATRISNMSSDPRNVARILAVTNDINARIGTYLALKTLLGIVLGALSWVIMAYMGLELAAFWALVIALLNYAPYIGSFLGVLLPGLMALMQFGLSSELLAVLVPLVVVQFVIGNFLDPYVMGKSLNLSPFAILVSMTVWSGLWGIPGAFLAVPVTAIMAIVLSEFSGTRPLAVLLSRDGRL